MGWDARRPGLVRDASGTPLGLSPLRGEDCNDMGGVIGIVDFIDVFCIRADDLLLGKLEREWEGR